MAENANARRQPGAAVINLDETIAAEISIDRSAGNRHGAALSRPGTLARRMQDVALQILLKHEANGELPWGDEPPPLVLMESRSLGGVLRADVSLYCCPMAPTNGQVGGFLRTKVAPVLIGNERRVLYVGDADLQGNQIEANTRRVLW